MTFKALLADKAAETISTSMVAMDERDLMPGDVSIAVDYSTGHLQPISDRLLSFIRRTRTFPSMMVFYRCPPRK
jgi:hypothetical protein